MVSRIEQIKQRLADARQHLNTVLDQVGDRWESQVYSDGLGWTVRQLVNHLADADKGHNNQVMNIAEGIDIIPDDFDIERYNRRITEKTTEKTAAESRIDLETSRRKLNEWLNTLDETKLDQKGRHASLRILTVEQILQVMVAHERNHANDIAAVLDIQT